MKYMCSSPIYPSPAASDQGIHVYQAARRRCVTLLGTRGYVDVINTGTLYGTNLNTRNRVDDAWWRYGHQTTVVSR